MDYLDEPEITCQTAKLAKELGFEFKSKRFYTDKYGLCEEGEEFLYINLPIPEGKDLEYIYDCNYEFGEGERYYAPTQSLLQKWLRDVYKIHIDVSYLDCVYGFYFNITEMIVNKQSEPSKGYKTFEEALEIGLQEAIKELLKEITK